MGHFNVALKAGRTRRTVLGALGLLLLQGCAPSALGGRAGNPSSSVTAWLPRLLPCPALMLGELHDAPDHPALQEAVVRNMAAKANLAALVLEMAETHHNTQGLPPVASEKAVRQALAWNERAWPWSRYRSPVMAAVRAGVPVVGGNLPRGAMQAAMHDATLDELLPANDLNILRERVRQGHCQLLPERQIPGMTRIQLARDLSMARAVAAAWRPDRTVVLICGNEHARQDLGVPRQLNQMPLPWPAAAGRVRSVLMQPAEHPAETDAGTLWPTARLPQRDHCSELRQQMAR